MSCECNFCVRHRKFKKHHAKIEDDDVKDFMYDIYDQPNHAEVDLDYNEILNKAYAKKHGKIGLDEASKIITE